MWSHVHPPSRTRSAPRESATPSTSIWCWSSCVFLTWRYSLCHLPIYRFEMSYKTLDHTFALLSLSLWTRRINYQLLHLLYHLSCRNAGSDPIRPRLIRQTNENGSNQLSTSPHLRPPSIVPSHVWIYRSRVASQSPLGRSSLFCGCCPADTVAVRMAKVWLVSCRHFRWSPFSKWRHRQNKTRRGRSFIWWLMRTTTTTKQFLMNTGKGVWEEEMRFMPPTRKLTRY